MCGICGIAGRATDRPPLGFDALLAMTEAITHRGPDEDGHHLAAGVALGMRRLSVIDLAASHQPVANERRDVWAVFNGEIFNFESLRRELQSRRHRFASAGDTETIVHLYEEHGPAFPKRLRGMFGIAVWDERNRRLVLARDRMGVKPLYYVHTPDGLGFASEIKSLLAGGLLEARLDPVAAELFLAYGYVPGPRTLFDGVRKLAPASTLVWEDGELGEETAYWTPWDQPDLRSLHAGWEEDRERLLELLRESVRARMISDVPLGVMLSGGLDSSLITALMAEQSSGPVKTFSVGFTEDAQANELADAQRVAARFDTDHHELLTSAVEHPGLLGEALWHLEEPIVDLSFVGFLLLSRLAREHVTVALSGQGADELLGGYAKHAVARAADALAWLPGRSALAWAGGRLDERARLGRGLRAVFAADDAERLLAMSRVVGEKERSALVGARLTAAVGSVDVREPVRARASGRSSSVLGETLHLDGKLALVDLMFLYFDKMSMAASLEVRVPFADHDVVAFCTALPDDRKVHRGRRKEILRRVSRGLLDDATIDKKKRGFFRAASSTWLDTHRAGLVREALLDGRARERGLFEPPAVAKLIDQNRRGTRAGEPLLAVLMLELWHRQFVDADAPGRALRARSERTPAPQRELSSPRSSAPG
jgi:asparagine synthase (glutamine-hydrolysing)